MISQNDIEIIEIISKMVLKQNLVSQLFVMAYPLHLSKRYY